MAAFGRRVEARFADRPRHADRHRGDPLGSARATSSPYLTWPLVTGEEGLANAAEIVAGRGGERVIRGDGDVVYATGIDPKGGTIWRLYRPGPDVHVAR